MNNSRIRCASLLKIIIAAAGLTSSLSFADCSVSTPNRTQPSGAITFSAAGFGWFGNESLAAVIPADGRWTGMGAPRFGDKFWWWKRGYEAQSEPLPPLTETATLVDNPSISTTPFVTNAYGKGWNAILVGMTFPKPGCWRVHGASGQDSLEIVLYVGE